MEKLYIEQNGVLEEISWKYVFNTDNLPERFGHISNAIDIVKKTGYNYFSWNNKKEF